MFEKKVVVKRGSEIPEEIVRIAEGHFLHDMKRETLIKHEYKKVEGFIEMLELFDNAYENLIKDTGILPFETDYSKIHIINGNVLIEDNKEKKLDNTNGFFLDGHIYLSHDLDFIKMFLMYSHEFMHMVSYKKKIVEIEKIGNDLDYSYKFFGGVAQNKESNNELKIYGSGFDEALTEFFALQLRQNLDYPDYFNKDEIDFLNTRPQMYIPQIQVIQKVFYKYTDLDVFNDENLIKKLLRLYVLGDPELLKELVNGFRKYGKPDGLKILYSMTQKPESAKKIANKLNL